MRIYFSGIAGVGLGPLAEIAADGGYEILGSDPTPSPMYEQLKNRGALLSSDQSGDFLSSQHLDQPIDWFVHTSALPSDHAELLKAQELGIRVTKRDVFLAEFIKEKKLKLIAVAGTHGKTTTTGMIVWLFQHFKIPVSYSVGSTLSFGSSGKYSPDSEWFVYECDEYDRNFLQFKPDLAVIPSYDYDHPDIYPTEASYHDAFVQFFSQSSQLMLWSQDALKIASDVMREVSKQYPDHTLNQITELAEEAVPTEEIGLPGAHSRRNAWLAGTVFSGFVHHDSSEEAVLEVAETLAAFPGTGRRFEKLAENLYSDYGHHPTEIAATLQMALEINPRVAVVYQPHQNVRQHEIKAEYLHAFDGAEKVLWLPTYLSRENPNLAILTPEELITTLAQPAIAMPADMNVHLWQTMETLRRQDVLVLCMGAGTIDGWLREQLI